MEPFDLWQYQELIQKEMRKCKSNYQSKFKSPSPTLQKLLWCMFWQHHCAETFWRTPHTQSERSQDSLTHFFARIYEIHPAKQFKNTDPAWKKKRLTNYKDNMPSVFHNIFSKETWYRENKQWNRWMKNMVMDFHNYFVVCGHESAIIVVGWVYLDISAVVVTLM